MWFDGEYLCEKKCISIYNYIEKKNKYDKVVWWHFLVSVRWILYRVLKDRYEKCCDDVNDAFVGDVTKRIA